MKSAASWADTNGSGAKKSFGVSARVFSDEKQAAQGAFLSAVGLGSHLVQ
jgi:hypothetical protein